MRIGINPKKFDITSENNTKVLSEKLSENLKIGDVVCLFGNLGVGKTTFIKYLINFLQKKNKVSTIEVPSPTFNILNEYKVKEFKILHFDLYRLRDKDEINNLGMFENKNDSLILIEWPEIIINEISNFIKLDFEYSDNFKKRTLSISLNKNKF
mgnify:FL=1|tara:strand:- start:5 stop:466 length:462 start_codon:yes stop_codon:yes gene_type:complete